MPKLKTSLSFKTEKVKLNGYGNSHSFKRIRFKSESAPTCSSAH